MSSASRPARTSTIPIPTVPANVRNIENVISIPPSSSSFTRNRIASSSSVASPGSPSVPRSVPRSASLSRSSFRQNFEPRVIRAGPPAQDLSCPPVSPTNNRRASFTGYSGPSAPARQRVPTTLTAPPLQLSLSSEAFIRPAYLDHSAFRDALVPEAPPPLVPLRKNDGTTSGTSRPYPSSDSDEESISSPPPRSNPSSSSVPPSQAPKYKLPTRWSVEERHQFLSVSSDGRDIVYNGSSTNGDKDGAAARANYPIPPVCGIYYYEVEIRGKEQKRFSGPNVKLSRLPGWENNSWGYHVRVLSGSTSQWELIYSQGGDKIGCGIDFSTRRAFYTKNGQFLGNVFENVGKGIDLYPAIGLQHAQESIRVNFGHEPFVFDIDNHVQQQKAVVWNKIMSTPVHRTPSLTVPGAGPSSSKTPLSEEDTKATLNNLVMSYLVHHGYAKTVRAFQTQQQGASGRKSLMIEDKDVVMEGTSPVKPTFAITNLEDDIERRKRIVNAVATGDIDTALKETQEHHPAVFEAEAGLMLFKLRCRKFVELVLATTEMKKEMNQAETRNVPGPSVAGSSAARTSSIVEGDWLEDDMGMDVDDDATGYLGPSTSTASNGHLNPVPEGSTSGSIPSVAQYEAAISAAIEYGQAISDDYKGDPRPEVQSLFKKTFGILAWDRPLEAGRDVAAFVSKEARVALANELNQAILKSQGRPAKPALETVYRQAAACVRQLGIFGEGSAAFADLKQELLDA
ncbi:ran-binding protein 10 [Coprinopsis cinerea okayama7|uniref:Ran-binding protein 10 n=1 Tax=Coprinopsis cinerea (strain Okayama-7 / 130 / ATCC MYA-4618 / FGSC 9003) TaxID=240176 RepID=A8N241_COPC7|nr:ran-binding protein 10 [Coprinopsis cinerea okayama7\|eukprot:XP_001828940.2 ran-binding protein 10 [Coprinopsis cinerea okayama7\